MAPKLRYSILLTSLLTLALPFTSALAAPQCENVLMPPSPEELWRGGSENSFMAFRSNAPHFWAWLKTVLPTRVPKNLQVEGTIAGDPHAANFGQVLLKNRKFNLRLVDLDDSGWGPLLGDFLRLSISIKESGASLKYKEIWDAYVDGLNDGDNYEAPGFIRKALDQTNAEFLEEQQEILTDRFNDDGEMKLHDYKLKSMQRSPEWVQEVLEELQKRIARDDDGTKIVNVGWKQKSDGGSQGMMRVWMLLKRNGQYRLIEYKQMSDPATAHYTSQDEHQDRVNDVRKQYWGTDKSAEYSVISTEQADFLMRSRFEYPVGQKIKKAMRAQGKKLDRYSLYLAYRLGQIHGEQSAGRRLTETLEHTSVDPQQILKDLANEYRDLLDENTH